MARKFVLALCVVVMMVCEVSSATTRAVFPKREVRAVWLTTIGGLDWPHTYARSSRTIEAQQAELRAILDKLQAGGVNMVLLQTRIRGTVIYPSDIEPWDGCMAGQRGLSPGYDPLAFAISECHARGMECHAWVVTIPKDKRGRQEVYADPSDPATGEHIAAICAEITERYDIDGIHLDYIRYPETWRFGKGAAEASARARGRENITKIVRRIHAAVKGRKPWVKLSCAPVGKRDDLTLVSSRGWNAYYRVCQDVELWLEEGLMDMIFPMMYFRDDQFFPFAIDWCEHCHGRIIVPGLGIYMLNPIEGRWERRDVERQVYFLRSIGLGRAYFRSRFFTDNEKGIYTFIRDFIDPYPALVPPMEWAKSDVPDTPEDFVVERCDLYDKLSWEASDSLYYNIYASPTYPVDTDDARNLLKGRHEGSSIIIPKLAGLHYAIRAINRYGVEGAAASDPSDAIPPLLPPGWVISR